MIKPSDFLETWVMVVKAGDRTQHFRTVNEAERYIASATKNGADIQRQKKIGE